MTFDISAYKTLYLQTAQKLIEEYVSVIKSKITEKSIQDLLRIFHSLKGQSLTMNYKNSAQLALEAEIFCRAVLDTNTMPSDDLLKILPSEKALLENLKSIEKSNTEKQFTKEIQDISTRTEELKKKHLTILLVEDDLFFQKICIDKLREKGVFIDFSDNGEDAIARMAVKKYDCILLDIIMPKKNGFDVLQYAKENGIIPTTPIIVFTTLGQEENIQKALSMGAADFINKGEFDFSNLMDKITSTIKK